MMIQPLSDDVEHELNPRFRLIGGGERVSPQMCFEPVHDMATVFEEWDSHRYEAVQPPPRRW